MSKNFAKISIKVGDIDIKIEGPYEFVASHYEKIEKQLLSITEIYDEESTEEAQPIETTDTEEVQYQTPTIDPVEVAETRILKKRGRKPQSESTEIQDVDVISEQAVQESLTEDVQKKTRKPRIKPERDGFNFSMSFKDWLNRLPEKASGTSKSVLAGYYIEYNNENHTFKAREVSKLLKAYNITLSNTSKFLKQGVDARRMIEVARNGKESEYMLTQDGINYVFRLLGVTDTIPAHLIP